MTIVVSGVLLLLTFSLIIKRACRCEYCGSRLKFRIGKPPICASENCAKEPSESDVHI
jgi:hypothetical protein